MEAHSSRMSNTLSRSTPCQNVICGQICFYPEGIQKLFPNDRDLTDLGVESYLGVPIANSAGQIIGHLAVLDDKPMKESRRAVSILNTFAARAGVSSSECMRNRNCIGR